MKALWVLLAGCASASIPDVRFANAPVATVVNDRRDVAQPPASRAFFPDLYFYAGTFERPVTRGLELHRSRRALAVNALDEAPDSTWFTNRITRRALTPAEITRGPLTHDPELHKPWAIQSNKIGGTTVGFIIKDATGVKYLLKFDGVGDPLELETGTHVIVNRILWACGYNVAEDQIVDIAPADLVIDKGAKVKDELGRPLRPLVRKDVDALLAKVQKRKDGNIRTLASRWIDGTTLGGHPAEGVREDDPNDRIRHEHRRDLRGLLAIDAWLDAVDVTEGQFVDAWITDPGDPQHHYVKHYAIDFGKSLGAMGQIDHDWWRGYAYRVDLAAMLRSFASVGVTPRPWQTRDTPEIAGVSRLYDVASFDPANWHPDLPGYIPFHTVDRFDMFWGAKLAASFTREQLLGAVAAGRLSDPRAADYLVDTLLGRQRKLAAYAFARVNPLDHFAMSGDVLCFDDLAIGIGFALTGDYAVTSYDWRAHPLGGRWFTNDATGRTCSPSLPLGAEHDGYTILRVDTARSAYGGTTYVHIARDPQTGAPRVIGLWRS